MITNIKTIILFQAITKVMTTNLICNGDFEGHTLPFDYWGEKYGLEPSNYSCWYNKNGLIYEIKQKFYPPVTSTAQLVIASPYTLCQNVTLQVGQNYQFNFSVVNGWTMWSSTVIVNINNQWLYNLTDIGEFEVVSGSKTFTAGAVKNVICFESVFELGNILKYGWIGPCIDNVTLVKITNSLTPSDSTNTTNTNSTSTTNTTNTSNTTNNSTNPDLPKKITINCKTSCEELDNYIIFACQHDYVGIQMIYYMQDRIQIYLEDQLQDNSKMVDITPTSMTIVVKSLRSYKLEKIIMVIPQDIYQAVLAEGIQVKFIVDGQDRQFHFLSPQEKKTIQVISPVASAVMTVMQQAYSVLKVSFFSYFLIDIISFWNLSLMYNFLNLPTVPLFSKYFLQKLEKILFNLDSIVSWMGSEIPSMKALQNIDDTNGRQLMPDYKNEYAWFGSFGISSGFVKNNLEIFLIVGLLLLKLVLMTILRRMRFLPKRLRAKFPRGQKKFCVFLEQILGIQIFMIVSAAGTLLEMGFTTFRQKINRVLQILVLFLAFIFLALYFLFTVGVHRKKSTKKLPKLIKKLREQTKSASEIKIMIRDQKKAVFTRSVNSILSMLPYVFIPFLIIFNNRELFLISTTLIFGLRLYWVYKHIGSFSLSKVQKVFLNLNLLSWTVHHGVYLVFWTVQILKQAEVGMNEIEVHECLKICGFITIFTVLSGGVFQLLNFLISVLIQIGQGLRKLIKYIKKSKIQHAQKLQQSQLKQQKKLKTQKQKELVKVQQYDGKTNEQTESKLQKNSVPIKLFVKDSKTGKSILVSSKPKKKRPAQKKS